MAARSSSNTGFWAAIIVLGLGFIACFVLFAIFFGQARDAQRQLETVQAEQAEIIAPAQRNRDDIRGLIQTAKTNRDSLVGYLADAQGSIMQQVTGNRRDTLADLQTRIANTPNAGTAPLIQTVQNLNGQIETLNRQLEQAEAARQRAITDLQNEVARITAIESRHQQTIDALTAEVNTYKNEIERYRQGADQYKGELDQRLDRATTAAAERQKQLEDQLAALTEERLILTNQLQALRGQRNNETLKPREEAALVDGQIIGVNSVNREAFISIGRNNRVVLGMTFTVYGDASQIRPDENGVYPPGKATLEVINVNDTTSICRVLTEARGNPIVNSDVIANAVYDPSKIYKFVVYGNFDVNRDGIATTLERQDLTAIIERWGGQAVDDLTGDVDFLVLGERPLVPPRPSSDAPFEVVQQFVRQQRDVERYDELFRQASSTSVPILNENRLYTLIGKR